MSRGSGARMRICLWRFTFQSEVSKCTHNTMDLFELLYVALGTIGILFVLHIGTFWLARVMQPSRPKIVYLPSPPQQPIQQPVQQILSPPPSNIQLPTYDIPANPSSVEPVTAPSAPVAALPPPVETRNTTKQSGGDLGAPR